MKPVKDKINGESNPSIDQPVGRRYPDDNSEEPGTTEPSA
jgi:hypothetical protein